MAFMRTLVQRIANRRIVPLITLLGFASLLLVTTISTFTATRLLERDATQRAMARIDSNMAVVWRLIHELGQNLKLSDGHLLVGNTILDGNFTLVEGMGHLIGGDILILRDNTVVSSNVLDALGHPAIGQGILWEPAREAIYQKRQPYRGIIELNHDSYYAGYDPIFDPDGKLIGTIIVGLRQNLFTGRIAEARFIILATSLTGFCAIGTVFGLAVRSLFRALQQGQANLREINQRLDTALDSINQGLVFFDAAGKLIIANRRYSEIYGLSQGAVAPGMSSAELMQQRKACGTQPRMDLENYIKWFAGQEADTDPAKEIIVELADNRMIAIHKQYTANGGSVATHEDITERHQNEERLVYMARHDALTGLPNRVLFMERIEQALARQTKNELFAVLYLDLDQFKAINDTLGHSVGDQLLQAVAERLRGCLREGDSIARFGGDEFAILQIGLRRPEEAATLARKILQAACAAYRLGTETVQTSVSIGITLSPNDGDDQGTLLKQADMALYRAKADGRATFHFFEQDMDQGLLHRRSLELDLRLAIEKDQLELYYQPMVEIRTGFITGFEALLRWRHPERGMISPAEFIPLAEEAGLILQMGAWVLRAACQEATNWPSPLYVAVNVSALQFKETTLVVQVREALHLSGLAPHRLELEITESILLQNNKTNLATLHELRDLGATIAMDDFGTGYSSLSYLRSFPFNKIKIDQSFVRDLTETEDSRAIVRAVTGLGQSLGMRVLAEGVETLAQLECLRAAGCEHVQGYLFSRPQPAHALLSLIEAMNNADQKKTALAG
jgi:diguanylate cyclase (GGDEF)-like protein/PAS domain S-box-containing protein